MYKKLTFLILLILFLFLGFEGCKKKQIQKPEADVIARVNEGVLTERDLEMNIPEAQRNFITPEQKINYVRRWIENEILYQEAKRKKIDEDETVKWRTDQVVRSTIIQAFLEKELEERVKVSEDEAKQYYQKNKNMFRWEEDEVRISHILVKNIAEAGLVTVRLQDGESFDMIASQMSLDGGTKERGGDMGYVPLSSLPPQFYKEITKLGIGGVSAPIRTDYGFDIVMVTDRKEKGSIKEYELVGEEVTNSLILTKKKKELGDLFEELKKEAKVETFGWASDVFPQ
ncbi:MAG: peptidyl-prolyl cis-trans isomerase [candidate division Zixibacteria bacterium]|nr:peptidyl-prolyl cis-trans isomerase [candidate division Zixibacteria bacterium]